jgi:hypothetical protein
MISAVSQWLLIALVTSQAASQTVSIACDPVEPLATFIESSEIKDVLFIDEYAYICVEDNELLIYNISDPQIPALINQIPLNDSPNSMLRYNDLIYVSVDNQDPAIYDISTPTMPVFVGLLKNNRRLLTVNDGLSVCVDLESDPEELQIYQTDTLGNTTLLSAFEFTNSIYKAEIHDDKLYLGSRRALDIYNISDPFNPQNITNFEDGHLVFDFVLRDSILLVSDNDDCVRAIDVSNTNKPIVVWEYETIDRPYRIDHFEDYLYVANIDGSVQVFDISTPSTPKYLGLINDSEAGRFVVVSPDFVLVHNTSNYAAIYAQDSWRRSLVGLLGQSYSDSRDVVVSGNTAYISANLEGLAVVDVTDPSNPIHVSTLSTFDSAFDIAIRENHLYLTDVFGGLLVYDISLPQEPQLVGWYTSIERASQVAFGVEHLYLTDSVNERVDVMDISNPQHPRRLSTYDPRRPVHQAIEHEHVMYLSLGSSGMHIVNVENPFNPTYVGIVERRISELFVRENLLFTADLTFEIYDVTDPEKPLLLSGIDLPTSVFSFTFIENLALLTTSDHGLFVVDVADPLNPHILHSYPTNQLGRLFVQDGLLYRTWNRFEVYDISSICIPCSADLNSDSMLNFLDVSLYLQSFASGSVSADLNDDGQLNFIDISAFLTSFSTGCTE